MATVVIDFDLKQSYKVKHLQGEFRSSASGAKSSVLPYYYYMYYSPAALLDSLVYADKSIFSAFV